MPDARCLAITISPFDGESLIGLVARATRANVLGRTGVILDGLIRRAIRPGEVGRVLSDFENLALQLGCKSEEISERCHADLDNHNGCDEVRWGLGALLRVDVETNLRRISPVSLSIKDYHRAAWMNRLLPYCPESFELLVSQCQACGANQSWREAWGIGICDRYACRRRLVGSGQRLPSHLAKAYKQFASLVSFDACEREVFTATLHQKLQVLAPTALIDLVINLGTANSQDFDKPTRQRFSMAAPLQVAEILCSGTMLLKGYPHSLRERSNSSATGDFGATLQAW